VPNNYDTGNGLPCAMEARLGVDQEEKHTMVIVVSACHLSS
jgi:hypothetical protein